MRRRRRKRRAVGRMQSQCVRQEVRCRELLGRHAVRAAAEERVWASPEVGARRARLGVEDWELRGACASQGPGLESAERKGWGIGRTAIPRPRLWLDTRDEASSEGPGRELHGCKESGAEAVQRAAPNASRHRVSIVRPLGWGGESTARAPHLTHAASHAHARSSEKYSYSE